MGKRRKTKQTTNTVNMPRTINICFSNKQKHIWAWKCRKNSQKIENAVYPSQQQPQNIENFGSEK